MECLSIPWNVIQFKKKRCVAPSVWENKLNPVKPLLCQDWRGSVAT